MSGTSPSDALQDPRGGATAAEQVGPNLWLVEEMHERFLADPASVNEAWRDFFTGYVAPGRQGPAHAAPPGDGAAPPGAAPDAEGDVLRGAAARIVANMEASLAVPTATSFRQVPAKLLEVNRRVINGYLGRTRGGKVSFTHLVGFALVRALADHVPALTRTFATGADGEPRVVTNPHVGLGLAVDLERRDGTRTLVVPCIRDADTLDFAGFVATYEDLIRRARTNKLGVDDFAGVTVTLTNPGTIGTERSVPRLMPGQGAIIGVGGLDYPAEYAGADPRTLAELGLSKVMTLSSTYDHRIIQGAESGQLLRSVHSLLLGEDGFYDEVFRSLGVPYEPVAWRRDVSHGDREETQVAKQMQVSALINMYRVRGHLIADLDPLAAEPPEMHPELDPATYGLTIWDLDREFLTGSDVGIYAPVGGTRRNALGEILHTLRDAYCRTVGIEYMHIQEPEEKRWIQEHVEGATSRTDPEDQRHILARLNGAEALERFLATKYVGQKRFGLEGAESLICVLDAVLERAADGRLDSVVMGMPHRGRLNVLVNIVGKAYSRLFREFEGYIEPDSTQGSGDVKYHLGQEGVFVARSGAEIPLRLAANPSHLEAVNPVVEGMVRARMDRIPHDPEREFPVLPILLHGDAAFAGQGVVAETFAMSQIRGYRVGGTVHVVVNNQLGFTTPPESARSSEYCTDIAKAVQAPILHVNGDDPEACVRVARLAFEFRQRFHKDVVIDLVCYRRHGHNEGDDPSYTQPLMYRTIEQLRSVRKRYVENLVRRGDLDLETAEQALVDFQHRLQGALEETRQSAPPADVVAAPPRPSTGVRPHVATGVDRSVIDEVLAAIESVPEGFTVHPKLVRQFAGRAQMHQGGEVDWALAEALSIGSLLRQGISVRLAGQDTRRGTFSQRHSTLFDHRTGHEHVPLRAVAERGGSHLWICDSLLSEYAALGFEYGYSVAAPEVLTMWEAQFGDFANGAQIVIDQYLVAAEEKWGQHSGLVLLLPHGYEGQGPEHSSSRIERFLTLCAQDNIQVCQPSTPAQHFHLLRRQAVLEPRRPLVVSTPKSGLRDRRWRSPVERLCAGSFEEVLGDATLDPTRVDRVVLASGKIAVEATAARDEWGAPAAIVRLEQLYPWPADCLEAALARFEHCREVLWLQEEPENMGAWNWVRGRLLEQLGDRHRVVRVSRAEEGSPATGSHAIHVQEQTSLLQRAFAPLT